MYAGLMNHLGHMSKFFGAYLLLFVIVPRLSLGKLDEDGLDNFVALLIRGILFFILSGYLLVLFKVYEALTLITLIFILVWIRFSREARRLGKNSNEDTGLFILRWLDKQINVAKILLDGYRTMVSNFKSRFQVMKRENYFFLFLFILVIGGAAYIRFYDAIVHAAVPLSDSYITLDWLKSVERRQLFYEPGGGVYPRGLSIYMATIRKFSFIDAIYVLKYTGPFNGVLIVLGILYVVYQYTGNKYAGLSASAIYGIGAGLLESDVVRQAATNSQEFAMVFLLPTLYFTNKYMRDHRKRDLVTACAGLTLMGLIHSFVYAFGVLGVSICIFSLFFKGPIRNFRVYLSLILGGILSAVVAVAPMIVGLLEGIDLHGSSVEFLTETTSIAARYFKTFDYFEIICIVFLSFYYLIQMRKHNRRGLFSFSVFLSIITIFFIFEYGGYLTQSILLAERTREIWALFASLLFGFFIGLPNLRLKYTKYANVFFQSVSVFVIVTIVFFSGLKPLEPYKMEWDAGVEQYLRITREFLPKSWTLIAEERQYAMVTGSGFLMTKANFMDAFPANKPFDASWLNLGETIFIYQQKNIYEVDPSNVVYEVEFPKYEHMRMDEAAMVEWLALFEASGGQYDIYYEDDNIRFIKIYNQAYDNEEIEQKIWGRLNNVNDNLI